MDKANFSSSYLPEIRSFLLIFGNIRNPRFSLTETVERIVHSQMSTLLKEAANCAKLRNAKEISHEEILFLMRKDKASYKFPYDHVLNSSNYVVC